MKITDTRAAFRNYDLVRDPVDHLLDPILPEEPGLVHAVVLHTDRKYRPHRLTALNAMRGPIFASYSGQYEALCGRHVKVILPMPFDTDEDELCPQCLRWLTLRHTNPAEFQRQYRSWLAEQSARQQEQEDVEEWNRRQGNIA